MLMSTKEKRLLFEYVKLHEPVWEINGWRGKGRHGLYKFWAYPETTWSDDLLAGIVVQSYICQDWKQDGIAPWDMVQKIVDCHRAGKVLDDLAAGLVRTVPDVVWSVKE